MINELLGLYNGFLNNLKGLIDENLAHLYMSEGWNQFSRILTNYIFDAKDKTDQNMERLLNVFRVSSKTDMDEIGEDIADLRRKMKEISKKLDKLNKEKE